MIRILIPWIMVSFSFAKKIPYFDRVKTGIENPMELRDPFKSPSSQLQATSRTPGNSIKENPEILNLEEVPLEQITVVATLLGSERRAHIKVGDDPSHRLIKEGDLLGPNKAEVKTIHLAGIVLVEKFINTYDQEEYLETVIPVSSEASVSVGKSNTNLPPGEE